jgi:hypothetical protein
MLFGNRSPLGRRNFLRGVAFASTSAVAATLAVGGAKEAQAYDPGKQQTRARYRADSADVQAFYRTNGYETLKKK